MYWTLFNARENSLCTWLFYSYIFLLYGTLLSNKTVQLYLYLGTGLYVLLCIYYIKNLLEVVM